MKFWLHKFQKMKKNSTHSCEKKFLIFLVCIGFKTFRFFWNKKWIAHFWGEGAWYQVHVLGFLVANKPKSWTWYHAPQGSIPCLPFVWGYEKEKCFEFFQLEDLQTDAPQPPSPQKWPSIVLFQKKQNVSKRLQTNKSYYFFFLYSTSERTTHI